MLRSISSGRHSSAQRQSRPPCFPCIPLIHLLYSFKVTEVALMMDWEDSSGSSGSEEEPEDMWNLSKAVNDIMASQGTGRASMRGLQMAISEGWLVQRARDMCSFAHDRYRQAAQEEARRLPEETIATMAFRVSGSCLLLWIGLTESHTDHSDDATRCDSRCLSHRGACTAVSCSSFESVFLFLMPLPDVSISCANTPSVMN